MSPFRFVFRTPKCPKGDLHFVVKIHESYPILDDNIKTIC
jgi:hypothetical protein